MAVIRSVRKTCAGEQQKKKTKSKRQGEGDWQRLGARVVGEGALGNRSPKDSAASARVPNGTASGWRFMSPPG